MPKGFKHGMRFTKTYRVWRAMNQRCQDETQESHHLYGGRGIIVCERWRKFESFFADMGECPANGSIDRIDTNGNYEPGNCRWATQKEQCRNKRNNVMLTHQGKTMSVIEWSELLGVSAMLIYKRIRRGWDDEKALTTPSDPTSGRFKAKTTF